MDRENDGCLRPKGKLIDVAFRYDGKARHDGRIHYGSSERNAVEAHRIDSGMYGGCFVSTSRSREVAERFVRSGGQSGWLYVIDEALLDEHGVVAIEQPNPLKPKEEEVSLRAQDGGDLPPEIVVRRIWIEA